MGPRAGGGPPFSTGSLRQVSDPAFRGLLSRMPGIPSSAVSLFIVKALRPALVSVFLRLRRFRCCVFLVSRLVLGPLAAVSCLRSVVRARRTATALLNLLFLEERWGSAKLAPTAYRV